MSARPEDIQRRLEGLDEIGDVVRALRAIASGHVAAARDAVAAIAAHEDTVLRALARIPAPPVQMAQGPGLAVVVGASQGFSGAYPGHLAQAAQRVRADGAGLLVLGARTLSMLGDTAGDVLWSAELPAHPQDVPPLASRVTDALIDLAVRNPGPIRLVGGRDKPNQPVETRHVWPPEPLRHAHAGLPPLTTLDPAVLAEGLLSEMLFSVIARAIMEGFMAENQARLEAMARARANLRDKQEEIGRAWRQARQEEMTTEMIELSLGRTGSEAEADGSDG